MSMSYLCQIYSYISHEYYQIQPPHQKVYVNCLVEHPKSWLHHEAGTLDYFHDLWSALSFTLWPKVFQSQKAENKISRDNRTQFCQELCQDLQCGSKSVFLSTCLYNNFRHFQLQNFKGLTLQVFAYYLFFLLVLEFSVFCKNWINTKS